MLSDFLYAVDRSVIRPAETDLVRRKFLVFVVLAVHHAAQTGRRPRPKGCRERLAATYPEWTELIPHRSPRATSPQ
jgi:hypothetical protein